MRTTEAPLNPLTARYADVSCSVMMTGVQALARLPLDQARRDAAAGRNISGFISGYEGSPLGGYDLELGRQQHLLDAHNVHFEPGLNEEAGAMAVQGTQLIHELNASVDGVVGYWYGKAPGLDRASDALRHANLMGTHPSGGAVAFVGDDPGAKSSTLPCASELALADLMMPTFYPCDPADILELGRHAVALSRASGLWAAMKIVTSVADGSATVDLVAGDSFTPVLPPHSGKHEPTSRLLQPTLGPLERDWLSTRMRIAREYLALNDVNKVVQQAPTDRIGIVTA
ncbi:MAG: 2-oxoacid ferredoxin oxidoreductase, partial [Leucobacter sp.]|nr:2-oxoacid ferredoxin oxidoreductase [Leucobacter sp.]